MRAQMAVLIRHYTVEQLKQWDDTYGAADFKCVAGWYWQYTIEDAPCGPYRTELDCKYAADEQLKRDAKSASK